MKSKSKTKRVLSTHANGEGSTKRAIRRGLEFLSFSESTEVEEEEEEGPSSLSSSSSWESNSALSMLVASSTKLFLQFTVFDPWKEHNRGFLQEILMGFACNGEKRWNLRDTIEGYDDEVERFIESEEAFIFIRIVKNEGTSFGICIESIRLWRKNPRKLEWVLWMNEWKVFEFIPLLLLLQTNNTLLIIGEELFWHIPFGGVWLRLRNHALPIQERHSMILELFCKKNKKKTFWSLNVSRTVACNHNSYWIYHNSKIVTYRAFR